MKKNKAFTLTELIVSITISALILLGIMKFIANTFGEFNYSNTKTELISSLYDAQNTLKGIKKNFATGSIIKDGEPGKTSDSYLLRTLPTEIKQKGYIFALVDKNTLKIDQENNIDNIGDKILGFRKISKEELEKIDADNNYIYELQFNLDEIFPNINLKDLQIVNYNSGKVFELILYTNLGFKKELIGSKYSEIGNNNIEKYILDF